MVVCAKIQFFLYLHRFLDENMTQKKKKIIAMTMVRNDRFLPKWVEYYSRELGKENIYVFFDGEDQKIPDFCSGINCLKIPKMQGNVAETDHQRSRFMSRQAAIRFAEGADMVIATDADEFLIVDPKKNQSLISFLSSLPAYSSYSGLGVDVLQHLPDEKKIDFSLPFLSQRKRGWLHSRYTKPSILSRPLKWGGGYHRIKGHNYHIIRDLYLFHFGGIDVESLNEISSDPSRSENGWNRHQKKRRNAIEKISGVKARKWKQTVNLARIIQYFCRPIFAPNKPTTFGIKLVVAIPERFQRIV